MVAVFARLNAGGGIADLSGVAVDSTILVACPEGEAIALALQGLLGSHPFQWRVTIRPSALPQHWSIEISRPGLFLACAANPSQQTASEIRDLVRGAVRGMPVATGCRG